MIARMMNDRVLIFLCSRRAGLPSAASLEPQALHVSPKVKIPVGC